MTAQTSEYPLEALLAIKSAEQTKFWTSELSSLVPKTLQSNGVGSSSASSARSAASVADAATGLPTRFAPNRKTFFRNPADRRKFGKDAQAGGGWRTGSKEPIPTQKLEDDDSSQAGWKTQFHRGRSQKPTPSRAHPGRPRDPAWAGGPRSSVDTDTFSLADVKVLARDVNVKYTPQKPDPKPQEPPQPASNPEDDDIDSFFASAALDLDQSLPSADPPLAAPAEFSQPRESWSSPGHAPSQPSMPDAPAESGSAASDGFSVDLDALFGGGVEEPPNHPQTPATPSSHFPADVSTPDAKPSSQRLNKLLTRSKRRLKMSPAAKQQKREADQAAAAAAGLAPQPVPQPNPNPGVSPKNAAASPPHPSAQAARPQGHPPAMHQYYPPQYHGRHPQGPPHNYPPQPHPYPPQQGQQNLRGPLMPYPNYPPPPPAQYGQYAGYPPHQAPSIPHHYPFHPQQGAHPQQGQRQRRGAPRSPQNRQR